MKYSNGPDEWAFMALFGFVVLAALLAITLAIFTTKACTNEQKITAIGGCDRYGECGVELANGSYWRATQPIVGQAVCIKDKTTWRFL